MSTKSHQIPGPNIFNTLFVGKFDNANPTASIQIQSPNYLQFPRVGEYFETSDGVDNVRISGFTVGNFHRNTVVPGPGNFSPIEVHPE